MITFQLVMAVLMIWACLLLEREIKKKKTHTKKEKSRKQEGVVTFQLVTAVLMVLARVLVEDLMTTRARCSTLPSQNSPSWCLGGAVSLTEYSCWNCMRFFLEYPRSSTTTILAHCRGRSETHYCKCQISRQLQNTPAPPRSWPTVGGGQKHITVNVRFQGNYKILQHHHDLGPLR